MDLSRLTANARPPLCRQDESAALASDSFREASSVNLRFVEAFVWVARLNSFTGAAEKLFTTQAAISSRISTLENEVGIRLFERDRRFVELTRQGRTLLPIAEQMLSLQAQFRAVARPNGKAEIGGTLRVGVIDTVALTWLPELLATFTALYPKATLELFSDITPSLRTELERGKIDCAILTEEVLEGPIESRRIADYPVVWVGSERTHLPDDAELTIQDIAALPIITFHRQSSVYKEIARLVPRDLRPKINHFSSMASMIGLVKSGFGVAALPLPAIRADVASGSLRILNVKPALNPLPIAVNVRTEGNSPMIEDFLVTTSQVCNSWNEGNT